MTTPSESRTYKSGAQKRKKKAEKDAKHKKLARHMQIQKYTVNLSGTSSTANAPNPVNISEAKSPSDMPDAPNTVNISAAESPPDMPNAPDTANIFEAESPVDIPDARTLILFLKLKFLL